MPVSDSARKRRPAVVRVTNDGGRVHFWDSRIRGVFQLVVHAAGFNHHGVVFNFNATDMYPALRGDQILFVADCQGAIVNDGQPVIRGPEMPFRISEVTSTRLFLDAGAFSYGRVELG